MNHYTYKTTNLINGKVYYGRHSAKYLPNEYLGSGYALVKAVKKYGKENFQKEILQTYDTFDLLVEGERNLITQEFVDDPNCYNMRLGGHGTILVREDPDKKRQRMLGNSHKLGKKEYEVTRARKSASMTGVKKAPRTQEHIDKMKASRKGKGTGERNAMASAENRDKVALSKLGRKRIYREDGTYYMSAQTPESLANIHPDKLRLYGIS